MFAAPESGTRIREAKIAIWLGYLLSRIPEMAFRLLGDTFRLLSYAAAVLVLIDIEAAEEVRTLLLAIVPGLFLLQLMCLISCISPALGL